MKYSVFITVVSAALASSQVTFNPTTGPWHCSPSAPNASYCGSSSLTGNLIIHCHNSIGHPSSCSSDLWAASPSGSRFAACYETSPISGDAVCANNCIAYSDDLAEAFVIPGCTPTSTTAPSVITPVYTYSSFNISNTTISTRTTTANITTVWNTVSSLYTAISQNRTLVYGNQTAMTNTYTYIYPTDTVNGKTATGTHGPTKTPVEPTATGPVQYTGAAANLNTVGGLVAGVGLLVAYFL